MGDSKISKSKLCSLVVSSFIRTTSVEKERERERERELYAFSTTTYVYSSIYLGLASSAVLYETNILLNHACNSPEQNAAIASAPVVVSPPGSHTRTMKISSFSCMRVNASPHFDSKLDAAAAAAAAFAVLGLELLLLTLAWLCLELG